MIQVIPGRNDWAGVFQNLGQGVSQGYQDRSDERAIQNAIMNLGPKAEARDVLNALINTHTYGNQAKQEALKNYMGVEALEVRKGKFQRDQLKEEAKRSVELNDARTLIQESDLPDDKKAEFIDRINQGQLSYKAAKEIVKPAKPNKFQEGVSKENVKLYTEAVKDLPKAERSLQDLNTLRELKTKLAGPIGYFKALNPFNEDAAEMRALGFGVLDSVIKIFNPTGPVAERKLRQLKDIYAISPTDTSATIEGKIKALEGYAQRAKSIAEQRIELFNKYNGNPPLDQIARLDKEGARLTDEMISQGQPKKTYYSTKNGKPLKEIPEEQLQSLLEQGLITDVKPE